MSDLSKKAVNWLKKKTRDKNTTGKISEISKAAKKREDLYRQSFEKGFYQ